MLLQHPATFTMTATETKPDRPNAPLLISQGFYTVPGCRHVAVNAFYNFNILQDLFYLKEKKLF